MNDKTKCLRCHITLHPGQRLICLRCFEKVPVGLQKQWQQARNNGARSACINRVRSFINALNRISPIQPRDLTDVNEDMELGERLIKEMEGKTA